MTQDQGDAPEKLVGRKQRLRPPADPSLGARRGAGNEAFQLIGAIEPFYAVEALAQCAMQLYAQYYGEWVGCHRLSGLNGRMMAALCNYAWPGNVRELQHIIERAMILTQGAELACVNGFHPVTASPEPSPLATLEEVERAHILKVLEATSWRISGERGAAELLGLPPTTLGSRLLKLGIVKNPKNDDLS